MSEQWDDLHLRSYFGDTGEYPTGGSLSKSPDIIPNGMEPIPDPEESFVNNNWDKDMGKDLVANAANYLYVRGNNLGTAATDGIVNLYYAPANLILYPVEWRNNQLQTSAGQKDVLIRDIPSGGKFVTPDAFQWVPEAISGTHYCLIGVAGTERNPNVIPDIDAIEDFAKFISENPNFGWRNVSVISADAPDFTLDVGYNQGSKGDLMKFSIVCTNVPVGAEVSFSAGDSLDPPIYMPPVTVTNGASFSVGMETQVPDNFSTTINYSYWSNGTTPPPGWDIRMEVTYLVSSSSYIYDKYALPLEQMYSKEMAADIHARTKALRRDDDIGPVRAVWMGGHSTYGK